MKFILGTSSIFLFPTFKLLITDWFTISLIKSKQNEHHILEEFYKILMINRKEIKKKQRGSAILLQGILLYTQQAFITLTTPRFIINNLFSKVNSTTTSSLYPSTIDNFSKNVFYYLKKHWEDLCEQPFSIAFNIKCINKEICLEMCKEHDRRISIGKKHPISADQQCLNEENKQKQKANNHLKNKDNKNQKFHDKKTT